MSQRRWLVLGLVFIGMVVSYIDRGNLSIVADTLMRELHFRPDQMGLLLSAFFWTYAFFQIPAGLLVDRYGIRRTYAAAFLLWSLASASIALSHGLPDILSARLALGLAESVGPVASLAFIRGNFTERESGLPVSIYIGGQMLGPALGTLLGASLLAAFGWRNLFAVTGLGALFWVPAWLYFAPRGKTKKADIASAPVEPVHWPWRAILTNPSVWCMSAVIFFASYFWYFVLTWMPAYLTISRKFSTVKMGQVLSTPHFVMGVTTLLAGWLADRLVKKTGNIFGIRILFAAGGLLGASSLLLLNISSNPNLLLPILLLCSCCYGTYASNFWTIAQNASPVPMVGRTIGYLNTLSQIAGALAPLVTGFLLGPAKDFRFAIWIAGSCPLVGCVCILAAGKNIARLRDSLESS
jgi:ACS family D-galactonate transporter-like MFS transporter